MHYYGLGQKYFYFCKAYTYCTIFIETNDIKIS